MLPRKAPLHAVLCSLACIVSSCLLSLSPRAAAALDITEAISDAYIEVGSFKTVTLKVKTCANVTGNETSTDPITASLSNSVFSETRNLGAPTTYGGVLSTWFQEGAFDYQSLTLRKSGTNAWCIEKVWLESGGATIWTHPGANPNDQAYIGVLPLSGRIWIDNGDGHVPSVRFSDFPVLQTKGLPRAPLDIAFHTCSATVSKNGKTDDEVSVVVIRDNPNAAGITSQKQALEPFNLNNPGDDREADQPDRYRLDDHGVGLITGLRVQKTGADGWCFDRVSIFVGSVEVKAALTKPIILDGSTTSSIAEQFVPIRFGTGSFDNLAAVGYPALPLRRSATWTYPDRGAAGQACRPDEPFTYLASLTTSDRCNIGLACLNNKCVASGGSGQLCNELDPYFMANAAGKLEAAVQPSCNKPAGELDCIMTEGGVSRCLPNAGQEGYSCRNEDDSRGECNYGMECQSDACVWVVGTEGYACYADVAVTNTSACEGDLLCTGAVPANECVDPLETAWKMAWLSNSAYEIQPSPCFSKHGFTLRDSFLSTAFFEDAEVLVGTTFYGNEIVVSFAGSESATDWSLTDANVKYTNPSTRSDWPFSVSWGSVRLHDGFMDQVMSVYNELAASVHELRNGGNPTIYVTGHSLGGAAAQIFAAMLNEVYQGKANIQVVTFGSPRVGNTAWQSFYNGILGSHTHRWVNDDDTIAGYPFNNDDWKQTGRRHELISSSYDPASSTPYRANIAFDTGERSVGLGNGDFGDHPLGEYIEGLWIALKQRNPKANIDWAECY